MTTDGLIRIPASTRQDGAGQDGHDPGGASSPTVDYIVERLRTRLQLLVEAHGLARRELLRVQHGIARLDQAGLAPSSNDFWDWTARPRAQVLIDRAGEVIDDELSLLIADIGFAGAGGKAGTSRHPITDWPQPTSAGEVDLACRVLPLLPRCNDLDGLGWWWQRRLRRAATVRALPRLLAGTTGDIGLTISRAEMQLLDNAPWAHGDRLLSAFELAYAEIERLGTARVRQAQHRLHRAQDGRLALKL